MLNCEQELFWFGVLTGVFCPVVIFKRTIMAVSEAGSTRTQKLMMKHGTELGKKRKRILRREKTPHTFIKIV